MLHDRYSALAALFATRAHSIPQLNTGIGAIPPSDAEQRARDARMLASQAERERFTQRLQRNRDYR